MRLRFHIAALAAALLFASCSDDPVRTPGPAESMYQTATVEMYVSEVDAVWGRSVTDLYVGGDALLHFDGSTWNPIELPERGGGINAIWEGPTGFLNTMGFGGMHQYDGTRWSRIVIPSSQRSWWAAADGQLFVLDYSQMVRRYDGVSWTELDSLPPIEGDVYGDYYYGLAGDAPDNLYAVGRMGTIAHFDGASWNAASYGNRDFQSAWKVPGGPLYVSSWYDTLYTFDGATLSPVDFGSPFRPNGIFGEGSNVYAHGWDEAGSCSDLRMLYGAQWRSLYCEQDNSARCAWHAPTGEVFIGTREGLLKIDGDQMSAPLGTGYEFGEYFADMWGSEDDGVFVVGYRALHYRNGEWIDLDKKSITTEPAYSIWGTSARDLWAVGRRMILHYDGTAWTWVSGANQGNMSGVWADKEEVIAVGQDGTIMRSDRETWEVMSSPTTSTLNAVWGWEDGAFAAGSSGTILRYDGVSWEIEESPVNWTILDLFGFNVHDVYAVGANPFEVCHFNGREWLPQDTGLYFGTDNHAIWGTSGNNLFVLNTVGGIIHYDGRSWTPLPRYSVGLSSLWGADRGDLFVAGGGIFRYQR